MHWYRIGTWDRTIRKFKYQNWYRDGKDCIRTSLILSSYKAVIHKTEEEILYLNSYLITCVIIFKVVYIVAIYKNHLVYHYS